MSYRAVLIAGFVVMTGPVIAQTGAPAPGTVPPPPPVQPGTAAPARPPGTATAPAAASTAPVVTPTAIPPAARMGGSATSATQ